MLNGRIYGAKRPNRISENPFANARDEEPEFVEWGYGGMGSVKGARSAGVVGNNGPGAVNWERLLGGSAQAQSGWAVPGGGRGGAGARMKKPETEKEGRSGESAEDDEDDDGSGLAWVKRRKRLREEKEKRMLEQQKSVSHESESVPAPQVTDSTTQATIKPSGNDSRPGPTDEHRHNEPAQNMGSFNHPDHAMKAISVPMPPRLLSQHRRTSSRGLAEPGVENNATALEDMPQQSSVARLAASETSSISSSESSEDETRSSSDEEEISEGDQEDEKRRTAIGAGVEKVTASFRH